MNKDFPHENPENWKWGSIYFNRNDSRLIVPKKIKWMGWTLNFAHPISYIFLAIVVLIIILATFQ